MASIQPRTSLLKFIYIFFLVTGLNFNIGTTPPRTNAGANDGRSGSHKVLAFKLPKAESKEALLQSLGTFFGKFGPVQELNVLKDKQGNNFCVTHFATDEAAQNCLRRSDEHSLLGPKWKSNQTRRGTAKGNRRTRLDFRMGKGRGIIDKRCLSTTCANVLRFLSLSMIFTRLQLSAQE